MVPDKVILKQISAELLKDERWKVVVLGNCWLCPYCGEIGARDLAMSEEIEPKILKHLTEECPEWKFFRGELIEPERLRRRAALVTFKHKIARHMEKSPSWRYRDLEGMWICPYCTRSTGIEVNEGDPGTPVEDRALTQISRHLLECGDYQDEGAQEKGEEDLRDRQAAINRKKRARSLRERIEKDAAWQHRTADKRWMCPFCAQQTEVPFDRDGLADAAIVAIGEHVEGCKAYKELGGKPRTERYLKDRVIAINRARFLEKLKRKLEGHPIWQFRDLDDVWYCGYCAQPTGIRIPNPRAGVDEAKVNEVWTHLSSCVAYVQRRAKLKTKALMQSALDQANRRIGVRRKVREGLEKDPRWRLADRYGSWFCPYCTKVLKAVSVPQDARLLAKTVEQVVGHLLDTCPDHRDGVGVERTMDELVGELRQLEGVRQAAAAQKVDLAASGHDEEWQRITHEMQEIRSQVGVAVELEKSIAEARVRQMRLLPKTPEIPGFEFGCVYRPCSSVSGDFYAFVPVSDHELGIAIGDIAGHGVEAALLMGLAKKLLEIHGRGRSSTAQTLVLTNADLYPDLDAKTFVTVFYGLLDTRAKRFKFSRAGHNPLVLYNAAREPRLQVLDAKGMALGMDMGPAFTMSIEELEVQLRRGDLLFEYTDGVVEAMNPERREFGADRLYEVIEAYGHLEAEYLLWRIERALADFAEGAKQKDDVTMIAIRVH